MTARRSAPNGPRVVGVIASPADMDRAMRTRWPPDFFELRLDRLAGIVDELEHKLPRLRAPLIITARHPDEGGANKLSLPKRRDLLTRFLNHAKYLDVELRSASAMLGFFALAKRKKVRRIISFHNFKSTPHPRLLARKLYAAKANGADIFKVATRTDTPIELARLLEFVTNKHAELPIAAMGIGRLGAISRVLLARAGSALVYASVGKANDIEGQLSLKQLRSLGIGRGVKS
ncbi:MAG: type I 3-dehydroquinate dehydratase [Candidatus Udaeobacter sp.]